MKKHLLVILGCLLGFHIVPASAQWAVIDPANLVQNMLTAVRSLEQIQNQVRQLQNEARMLSNDSLNLRALDFNALRRLQQSLAATDALLNAAQGLALDVNRVQQQFAQLYPQRYGDLVPAFRMWQDAQARWQRSQEALATSVQLQAQARANIRDDANVLADVIARSQAAVGALQAAQATNQLLALAARQSIQSQELAIVQDRADALEHARMVAAEARAQEVRRRFQGQGVRYSPHTVAF